MTDRQLDLIYMINDYVNDEEVDLYLDFDDYRELDALLQENIALVSLCKKLYNAADMLCDRMTDFPAGCDACSLYSDDYDEENGCYFCEFEQIRNKYKEIIIG
jgi:hypothetical protein